mgnify:CR=1 FL=1
MIRKEPADWVFFNVKFPNKDQEAIAIYKNKVVEIGSIPFIFSNYRGFKDYNAQGFSIANRNTDYIELNDLADGIVVFKNELTEANIIWEMSNGSCISRHTELLDPHWDDH